MIYLLGQSVKLKWGDGRPGIITGFNNWGTPLVTYKTVTGDLKTHEPETCLEMVREVDESKPDKHRIYYGPHCKGIYLKDVKLKLPSIQKIEEELKNIEKLVK